jgi:hypothetical protein
MLNLKYRYFFVLSIVLTILCQPLIIFASNVTKPDSRDQSRIEDSLESPRDTKTNTQIIVLKDERETNNQHDWTFYILNIIITSALTLLINYLNSKFEIIKMQNEPSIDRLKTIAIEGIKTEKRIYTDLKSAQEHLSFGRKEDALKVATDTSNFLEENKMDVKPSLYTYATDIISYITLVAQGKDMRSELTERKLFETYFKEYRQ